MRIKIINPDYGMTKEEMDERCRILSGCVGEDVELSMECLTKSRVYLDSALDAVLAGPEIVTMAKKAQEDGFDAVVLYCFSDPAVEACRELLTIPVVGGGQAACLTAMLLGRRAGILITDAKRIPEKLAYRKQTGLNPENICSIQSVDLSQIHVWADPKSALERLGAAGQRSKEEGAEVLILGCLSLLGLGEPLGEYLGIPVVDGAKAAVSLAESLVRQKLFTSKISYAMPPARERRWDGGCLLV